MQDGRPNQKNPYPEEVTENCFSINRQTYKMTALLFFFAITTKPSCATTSRRRPLLVNRIQNTKAFTFKDVQLEHFVINDPLLEATTITSWAKPFNNFLFVFKLCFLWSDLCVRCMYYAYLENN